MEEDACQEFHEHASPLHEIKALLSKINERITKLPTEADLQAMEATLTANLSAVRDRLAAQIQDLSDKVAAGQASAITDADIANLKAVSDQLADPTFGEPAAPAPAPAPAPVPGPTPVPDPGPPPPTP